MENYLWWLLMWIHDWSGRLLTTFLLLMLGHDYHIHLANTRTLNLELVQVNDDTYGIMTSTNFIYTGTHNCEIL